MKVLDMRDEISTCISYVLFCHELKIEIEEGVNRLESDNDERLLNARYMIYDMISERIESGLKEIEEGLDGLLKHNM